MFIKLGNEVATCEVISVDALYVYSYLCMWQHVGRRELRTNVSIISNYIPLLKKTAHNRSQIRKCLESLTQCGLIQCSGSDTVMEIKLVKDWGEFFVLVPSVLFDSVQSPNEWATLCYILAWAGFRSKFSHSEFATALGCSSKTVQRLMKSMESRGLISVSPGNYISTDTAMRRDINSYTVTGGVCGETAAYEAVRANGIAFMTDDQRLVGGIKNAAKVYFNNNGSVVARDVREMKLEQKKKLVEEIRRGNA